MGGSIGERRALARKTVRALAKAYPRASCALRHSSALELLVATILSAQCADERVNKVTEGLFRRCRRAADYARVSQGELEALVRSAGFYRNKARNIRGAAALLESRHGGRVPGSMGALLELPGVARKTANVVLGTWFGKSEGVVVDTHVLRLSRRLGLSSSGDPGRVERDLMDLLPRARWTLFSHRMIAHGRRVCRALKPDCPACPLRGFCPSAGDGA